MLKDSIRHQIVENWRIVCDEVASAARAAGRSTSDVRVIGVSKYVDVDTTRCLVEAGCTELGESRPQSLVQKAAELATEKVRWHLIGSLQRNKAKRIVELAYAIHSIDSVKLLQAVADYAIQLNRNPVLLVEVNVSGEVDKHGFNPTELLEVWPQIMAIRGVEVTGLMAMSGLNATSSETRRQFAIVRETRDTLVAKHKCPLPELSMGMSGDYAEAVSEGATMVRIGSRLFEGLLTK